MRSRFGLIGAQLLLSTMFLTSCIALAVTTTPTPSPSPSPSPTVKPSPITIATASCQSAVLGMLSLTQDLPIPENLAVLRTHEANPAKVGGEFDVNDYFSVLSHLSMQSGYLLDYVYWASGGGDGYPVIYARQTDELPYRTYVEFERIAKGTQDVEAYIQHIKVDGTAEGFFQLVALRMMGSQFYLQWHANYTDFRVICSADDLKGISPEDVRQKAQTLRLEPMIEFKGATVTVTVTYFTKWGGLLKAIHTIRSGFPHTISDTKVEELVPYDSGILY